MMKTPSVLVAICVHLISVGTVASEVIGPYAIQAAPVSAQLIQGGDFGWLNVTDEPIGYDEAFSGSSIISDGMANDWNEGSDTIVEVTFAPGAVVNGPGPDLVMFDARFSQNSYMFMVDYDNFTYEVPLYASAFVDTGIDRMYYYLGSGPYSADVMAAEIDLASFGVPSEESILSARFRCLHPPSYGEADPLGVGSLTPEPSSIVLLVFAGLIMRPRHGR